MTSRIELANLPDTILPDIANQLSPRSQRSFAQTAKGPQAAVGVKAADYYARHVQDDFVSVPSTEDPSAVQPTPRRQYDGRMSSSHAAMTDIRQTQTLSGFASAVQRKGQVLSRRYHTAPVAAHGLTMLEMASRPVGPCDSPPRTDLRAFKLAREHIGNLLSQVDSTAEVKSALRQRLQNSLMPASVACPSASLAAPPKPKRVRPLSEYQGPPPPFNLP